MSGFLDPAARPERSCAGLPQDVFFMSGLRRGQVQAAQAVCAGCPVLAECAGWAAPLVRARLLTDCVVAAVLVPTVDGSKARRHEAADRLARIAAGDRARVRGAA